MAASTPPSMHPHMHPPAAWPPMLGPAAGAFMGAGLGWLSADGLTAAWLLALGTACAVSLVVVISFMSVSRRTAGPRRGSRAAQVGRFRCASLALACLFICFGHLSFLARRGQAAQVRLAGGVHRESGTVLKVITPADPADDRQWGRVSVRLADGSPIQLSGGVGLLLPGQRIDFQARFERPAGQRNPGGFDERLYLAKDGIFLDADLFLNRLNVTHTSAAPIGLAVLRLRQSLAGIAQAILPQAEAALLLGILMGDTSHMAKDVKLAFQASGLSHLTAVSGANVAFLMAPTAFMLGHVLRRRRSRVGALIGFVIGFAFLTGWEASVTRAILMAGLALTGKLVRKRSDALNALLFAATGMLLVKPLLIISLSFHLSILATAGILTSQSMFAEWLQRWTPRVPEPLRTITALNLSVQAAVLPLQALATGVFSPLSLLANLPALPLAEGATLFGAGLLLGAALLMPLASHWPVLLSLVRLLAWPVGVLLKALARLAAVFADEAWPRLLTARLPALCFMALFLLSFCLVVTSSTWRHSLRKVAVCLLAAGLVLQYALPWHQPELEIWMLDVGQGDAMVIRARDGTVTLVDGGPPEAGLGVVRPALQAIGIRTLSQAIATHGHADHAGGLAALMAAGQVRRLLVPQMALDMAASETETASVPLKGGYETDVLAAILAQADQSDITVQGVGKGDTIPIGSGATLTVLAPEARSDRRLAESAWRLRGANASSLIMRLSTASGQASMLLMGDCDQETEAQLLRSGQPLQTDILRVAHHGSNATTGRPLLSAVRPRWALISVGRNDYGHPAPPLLDRLAQHSAAALRTDRQGAVLVRVYRDRTTIHAYLRDAV